MRISLTDWLVLEMFLSERRVKHSQPSFHFLCSDEMISHLTQWRTVGPQWLPVIRSTVWWIPVRGDCTWSEADCPSSPFCPCCSLEAWWWCERASRCLLPAVWRRRKACRHSRTPPPRPRLRWASDARRGPSSFPPLNRLSSACRRRCSPCQLPRLQKQEMVLTLLPLLCF